MATQRKRLYCLIDTETTAKNQMVFDFAYQIFDKHGFVYAKNAFLFKDVLAFEQPYYMDKVASYWTMVYKQLIKPVSVKTARRHFNHVLKKFRDDNYEIVICAYNASFDVRVLGMTSRHMVKQPFLDSKEVKFLDLWHAWVNGCPKKYGETAEMSAKGNIRTNAESAYRYEAKDPTFIERHVAFSDAEIEKFLLLQVLKRKKKLHIVDDPKLFVAHPWKIAQERCRVAIEHRKAKQLSLQSIVEQVPAITISKDHQLKMDLTTRGDLANLRNVMLDEG